MTDDVFSSNDKMLSDDALDEAIDDTAQNEKRWGTIFMGPTPDREAQLDTIRNRRDMELWNRQTESEYMERVRKKALLHARAVLVKAQENAQQLRANAWDWAEAQRVHAEALRAEAEKELETARAARLEAEAVRDTLRDSGYNKGMEQAVQEFEDHCAHVDATTLAVLRAIEEQTSNLFDSWKAELAGLVRTAVEVGLNWVLTEERIAVLGNLLHESVKLLEEKRRIVVRAHPDDALAVEEVLGSAQRRFTDLQAWEVIPDATLTPGGLIVESLSGRVESYAETRFAAVQQALEHLTLPTSEADANALNAVHNNAAAGVHDLETALSNYEEKRETRAANERAAVDPLQELDERHLALEQRLARPLEAAEGDLLAELTVSTTSSVLSDAPNMEAASEEQGFFASNTAAPAAEADLSATLDASELSVAADFAMPEDVAQNAAENAMPQPEAPFESTELAPYTSPLDEQTVPADMAVPEGIEGEHTAPVTDTAAHTSVQPDWLEDAEPLPVDIPELTEEEQTRMDEAAARKAALEAMLANAGASS